VDYIRVETSRPDFIKGHRRTPRLIRSNALPSEVPRSMRIRGRRQLRSQATFSFGAHQFRFALPVQGSRQWVMVVGRGRKRNRKRGEGKGGVRKVIATGIGEIEPVPPSGRVPGLIGSTCAKTNYPSRARIKTSVRHIITCHMGIARDIQQVQGTCRRHRKKPLVVATQCHRGRSPES
jgi:hypothetical protein